MGAECDAAWQVFCVVLRGMCRRVAPVGICMHIRFVLVKKFTCTSPRFLFCLEFSGCDLEVEENSGCGADSGTKRVG